MIWKKIRTYLLTGIVVAAPILITLYLSWLFIDAIDASVSSLIPPQYNPQTYLPFPIPGLGLILVIFGLIIVGFITANFAGRTLLRWAEHLVNRTPIIRTIYGTSKQVVEAVIKNSETSFREVVLVEYPSPGTWALAFVTADAHSSLNEATGEKMVSIFLPTTPNPTSGYLLVVPRNKIRKVDMSVADGIRYIISIGMTTPDSPNGKPVSPPPKT